MDSQSPEDQRKHTIVDPHGHEKNSNTSPKDAEKIVEYGGPNNRYGRLNVMLGKGAYKIVWKALDLEEGIEVAWNCSQVHKEYSVISLQLLGFKNGDNRTCC